MWDVTLIFPNGRRLRLRLNEGRFGWLSDGPGGPISNFGLWFCDVAQGTVLRISREQFVRLGEAPLPDEVLVLEDLQERDLARIRQCAAVVSDTGERVIRPVVERRGLRGRWLLFIALAGVAAVLYLLFG